MTRSNITGFTLIELLLYVGIVSALLLGVTAFFAISADARIKNQSISEVNQQGQFAMDVIAQTVRNADSITAPTTGASAAQLIVAVPTASLSPSIINVSSGVLQIKEGAAAAVPLTNGKVEVTSLSVKNLSRASTPGTVQISFTLNRINPNNRGEYSYQKTFTTTVSIRP
jgi:Tfp pilus assembly protein PilW